MTIESPTVRSYRELLGVSPNASGDELKKAYHRLALLYHPDRNSDPLAAEQFQRVRSAFEILGDPLRIRALNETHVREKLFNRVFEGINICFGSFFGYRIFSGPEGRVEKSLRLGDEKTGEADIDPFGAVNGPIEQDTSVLDNPAYDALETVYAGKFSVDDEERLQENVGQSNAGKLPWVIINNQGILHFLDGDIHKAKKSYEELNERIPNNIIFMYRLGLCHILEGFLKPERTFFGFERPNRIEIEKGINYFRKCIQVGETRAIGKQRCLVIRKILADVYEKTGRPRQAKRIWKTISEEKPNSVEANLKTKGLSAAKSLLSIRLKRQRQSSSPDSHNSIKLLDRSKR